MAESPDNAVPGDDAALIARAQGGDQGALDAILRRFEGPVYRFAMRMCRNPQDAQDALQETLLAAVRGLDGFRGDAKLSSWLFSIARRVCIKKRSRRRAEDGAVDAADALVDGRPLPEESVGDRELLAALDSAVQVLDPDNRAVLLLRDVEGLSARETADALEMTVPQVKSRLHRARAIVREHMLPTVEGVSPIEGSCQPGCPDVVDLFSHYLEDDIDPEMCTKMQDHIEQCSFCRSSCDSLKRTVSVCNAAPAAGVPRDVQVALRHQIRQQLTFPES